MCEARTQTAWSTYIYDAYARPSTTTSPHGAVTSYIYNDSPLPAFEKVTTNNKWVKKTKDGLGRVVLVEAGYGSTTVSKVTTEYAGNLFAHHGAYSGRCRSPFRDDGDHDSGTMAIRIPG